MKCAAIAECKNIICAVRRSLLHPQCEYCHLPGCNNTVTWLKWKSLWLLFWGTGLSPSSTTQEQHLQVGQYPFRKAVCCYPHNPTRYHSCQALIQIHKFSNFFDTPITSNVLFQIANPLFIVPCQQMHFDISYNVRALYGMLLHVSAQWCHPQGALRSLLKLNTFYNFYKMWWLKLKVD